MGPTIASPLHILHLSTPETPHTNLFKDTETHEISTPYYDASIPIWRDSLPTTPAAISAWKDEWTAPEAGEVVRAVGAWVLCFSKPRTGEELSALQAVLAAVSAVVERHCGGSEHSYSCGPVEPLLLAVGVQQTITPSLEVGGEEWEDLCRECGGWEWIDGSVGDKMEVGVGGGVGLGWREEKTTQVEDGVNEYGEKIGMARLEEALEAHEWDGPGGDDFEGLDDLGLDDDDDDAGLGFGEEAMEAQMELWGMQSDVREEGQRRQEEQVEKADEEQGRSEIGDQDVQELETMMLKMQAVRDMGADMAEGERKKFAAKAVREVLKKM